MSSNDFTVLAKARQTLQEYRSDGSSLSDSVRIVCEAGQAIDDELVASVRSGGPRRTLAMACLLTRAGRSRDSELRGKALSVAMELARSPGTSTADLHQVLTLLGLVADGSNVVVHNALVELCVYPDAGLSSAARASLLEIGLPALPSVAEHVARDPRFAGPARLLIGGLDARGEFRPERLPDALPALRQLVESGDDGVATLLLSILERMGPRAGIAAGELARWVSEGKTPAIRRSPLAALRRVAPDSPLAIAR